MKTNTSAKCCTLASCLALTIAAATASAAELSGTPDELRNYLHSETRTVTIHEEATETAYSDIAKVTLVITTEARQLAEAMQANKDMRESVITEVKQAGIGDGDIKSAKYSASPQFGWFGDDPNSFEVVNSMTITIDTEIKFQAIAGISDTHKSVRFAGVKFEHSEKDAYEDKVRENALQEVLDNVAYFEKRLGLRLTPVQFSYSDVHANAGGFALEEIVVNAQKARGASMLSAAPPQPASSFDELEYRVSVAVTFEIALSD